MYTPGCERGLRYDDPVLGIEWPLPVTVISDKDGAWPLLETGSGQGRHPAGGSRGTAARSPRARA